MRGVCGGLGTRETKKKDLLCLEERSLERKKKNKTTEKYSDVTGRELCPLGINPPKAQETKKLHSTHRAFVYRYKRAQHIGQV